MEKKELFNKIKATTGGLNKEQILGWVESLPGSMNPTKPTDYKVGDVYMHQVFRHPCVLIKKKKDGTFLGTILTSEETCSEILEKCDSRFFSSSFFTMAIFTVNIPIGNFMSMYDNDIQINTIYKKLKKIIKNKKLKKQVDLID